MNHIDLFSGIGGFTLATKRVWPDIKTLFFCEKDLYCQFILKKHWTDVPIIKDIFDVKKDFDESVFILTGGFPCQPFSQAGKRRGTEDDRWLWPEMLRIISLYKPTWVIAENVYGLVTQRNGMVFEGVLSDLENEGYEVQPFIIPACAVNAWHQRDRIWIIAHSNSERCNGESIRLWKEQKENNEINGCNQIITHINSERCKNHKGVGQTKEFTGDGTTVGYYRSNREYTNWQIEPHLVRVVYGVPNVAHRVKALGNAIVPQLAEKIMRAIKETEEINNH